LEGEADQQVGFVPGDVYLRLFTRPHETFKRVNNVDLETSITISLRDSLLGFSRDIVLLDGTVFTLKRVDLITKPGISLSLFTSDTDTQTHRHIDTRPFDAGEVLVIPNMGMPIFNTPHYGRLLINVTVDFPDENYFTDQDKHCTFDITLFSSFVPLFSPFLF
jgi:DnaJ-class molecular chaperone